MKSIINIILFIALALFCFSWFNSNNPGRNDPTTIPYIGQIIAQGEAQIKQANDYLSNNPGNIVGYLQNNEQLIAIWEKVVIILQTGMPQMQNNG
jgi:hypothetical protein